MLKYVLLETLWGFGFCFKIFLNKFLIFKMTSKIKFFANFISNELKFMNEKEIIQENLLKSVNCKHSSKLLS